MLTVPEVETRLRTLLDPETGLDLVSMGLIYKVFVDESKEKEAKVHIIYTLTTPVCPLATTIQNDITTILADCELSLELTFDPPWNTDRLSAEARAELGF